MKKADEELSLTINGTTHTVAAQGSLLTLLRERLGLVGAKNGCGTGECGSCTVLVNGKARRSCTLQLERLDGAEVTTIEALSADGELHPIQHAFLEHGAVQCGFCTPGMVLSVKALLDRNPRPTEEEIRAALQGNLCRCTGYLPIIRAVQGLAGSRPKLFGVAADSRETADAAPGKSPRRKDALPKVRGQKLFADDYAAPGQIYGAFAFSEEAHARLVSVETGAAESVPGVVTVLTARDLPGRNGYGLMVPHQPVFAEGEIRYRGEVVAAVFAESEAIAREAAGLISGRYEPLEPMMDPEANMSPEATPLHPDGNVAEHYEFTKGEPEAAFAEAEIVIEGEYHTESVEHAYLEPEACLALPRDSDSPDAVLLTLYTPSQGSYRFREMIAASLDLPEESVRVIYTPCGGGFGGKEEPAIQIPCALAAHLTGRPVKMRLNREESIRISTKRHAAIVRMRHAARSDGTILAVHSETICDAGAYMSLTQPVVFRSTVMASGPYEIPNVRAEAWGVYTTKNPSGAFRGFGSTQVAFAVEVQMDRIARAAGVDPMELRKRHALAPGRVNAFGHRVTKGIGYPQTLEAVELELRRIGPEIESLREAELERGRALGRMPRKIGVGLASSFKNVGLGKGLPDGAGAVVEIDRNGTVTIYVGATDMGQGSDTVFAQIAAVGLGLPYETVSVVSSDTSLCPDGGMTTASRQTFVTGNAVIAAASALRERLEREGIFRAGSLDLSLLGAAVDKAGGAVREERWYNAPKTYPLQHFADHRAGVEEEAFGVHFGYCFATQAVVLAVDPETGAIELLRVIAAQDAGRVLHRQNVLGQIEGGVMMGLGYGLQEAYSVDEQGRGATTFRELGVMRIKDMPPVVAFIVEEPHPDGPFQAKGLGEIPLNPTAPAIANAVADAIGFYPTTLPIDLSTYRELHGGPVAT
ncbi:MAG: molybdopterin-dependent oxidoreductase [Spirochaetaceae bacterium]